jgi:TRAP-type C4-dicarboxylate transport system substrate-binding protein
MSKDKFKLLSEEYQNEVLAADEETLKNKAQELIKNEHQVYQTKDSDVELTDAKEKASELAAPYAQALKEIKQKRSFVALTLENRGKA